MFHNKQAFVCRGTTRSQCYFKTAQSRLKTSRTHSLLFAYLLKHTTTRITSSKQTEGDTSEDRTMFSSLLEGRWAHSLSRVSIQNAQTWSTTQQHLRLYNYKEFFFFNTDWTKTVYFSWFSLTNCIRKSKLGDGGGGAWKKQMKIVLSIKIFIFYKK